MPTFYPNQPAGEYLAALNALAAQGVTWEGTWSGLTTYDLGDGVAYNGSSYRSLQAANLNHTPPAPAGAPDAWWDLLAQKGDTGAAGTAGAAGTPGSVWRASAGAPDTALGVNGDFFLDSSTGDVYLKIAGLYQVEANIKGAPGTAGPAGAGGNTFGSIGFTAATMDFAAPSAGAALNFAEGNNITFATNTATHTITFNAGTAALGNAAYLNAGTTAGCVPQILTGNRLPALDASLLTNVPGAAGALVLLSTFTVTAAQPTIDVETTFSSTYDSYEIEGTLLPTTDGAQLLAIFKVGGAYDSGANYTYRNENVTSAGTTYVGQAGVATAQIAITAASLSNAASEPYQFTMRIKNPSSTAFKKQAYWEGVYINQNGDTVKNSGVGNTSATTALTGVRFFPDSGNFAVGSTVRLYAKANS